MWAIPSRERKQAVSGISQRPLKRAPRQLGGALLAVLWLSAALSAIAFSLASTVRGEMARASNSSDGLRAYYLAAGSIDRACLWMFWGLNLQTRKPDGTPRYYSPGSPRLDFDFPTGRATVEIIPESGKLNVNTARPDEIASVLIALGIDGDRAGVITSGIINWRSAAQASAAPPTFGPGSTFRARGASLEELEEILLVPGMTPDIFYGRYDHEPSGRLIPRGGLRDCLTVWGAASRIDVNTAPTALLESIGIPAEIVKAIIAKRTASPFRKTDEVNQFVQDPGILSRLGIGGASMYTLRATARLKGPNSQYLDIRRTAGAVVKFLNAQEFDPPYHILRWYDDAWTPGMPVF